MPNDKDKTGTDGDDYLNMKGYGNIDAGKGEDIVVLSEGDFFNIEGFQDRDNLLSDRAIERTNNLRSLLGREELEVKQDRLLMFIDPEKESVQEVQYFIEGDTTYVQVYDQEQEKVVSAARVHGTDFSIEVVGENGTLGVEPTLLTEVKASASNDIRELIAKGELSSDANIQSTFSNYIERQLDNARSLPVLGNLIDRNSDRTPGS